MNDEEIREEFRLNREFQAQQVDLMKTIIDRNGEAFMGLMAELGRFGDRIEQFGDRIEQFGDRIEQFGERVDAFGATLDLQREILLRFLDRLDDGGLPQG